MIEDKEVLYRIGRPEAEKLIVSAEEAALMIKDGSTVGISGFTNAGYAKAVPAAMAKRAESGDKFQVALYSGASVGPEVDGMLVDSDVIARRFPYQNNPHMREKINNGQIAYQDIHLSMMPQYVNYGYLKKPDVAIIEVIRITEEGNLILTSSVGCSPTFVANTDNVIVEIAMKKPLQFEGMHDIYTTKNPPEREPIPIRNTFDRIGKSYLECGWDKIKAIVISEYEDLTRPLNPVDDTSKMIGDNIIEFFRNEVKAGRLPESLLPIQSGVGSVANAVLYALCDAEFRNMTCYTEVMQDSMLDLLRSGNATVASTTAISPSPEGTRKLYEEIDFFKDKIVIRPQEISNNGEVVRRLGVIALNTALEADIYGNVNSTNVCGKKIMNGLGGSGDFSRNAGLVIFTTPSIAKGGKISSIVPMCSHVDHTEHEVNVIVTEQGYADLRGLCPKERAIKIIENCAHPDYKDMLMDYFNRACEEQPCQTPHILKEALSWHVRYEETGSMK